MKWGSLSKPKSDFQIKSPMKILRLILAFIPLSLFEQPGDPGNWFIYFGDKKIDQKWNWHHEIQYRNFNFIGDMEQLLLRTGIGYNLTENNNNVFRLWFYIQRAIYWNYRSKI